jgi:hypothetical protein
MSVVVYKDGVKSLIEPLELEAHLENGFTVEPKAEKEPAKEVVEEPMTEYERELRDKIKALGGKVGGRASLKTIESKLKELEEAE